MNITRLTFIVPVAMATLLLSCGGDDEQSESTTGTYGATAARINPADFSKTIDNPLFPLSSFKQQIYEGGETDPDTGETIATRVEMTMMPDEEKTVAGVEVLVVQDQAFEDDELVESTLDYFAQHKDGSVYYFGEDVTNYENGEVKDHDGSWLAGDGNARPGVIMPPAPVVGDVFEQEQAPGVAEDRMTVLSVTESVTVPAGSYENCVKTEDVNPLDQAGHIEFKFYCPGVGFTLEEFAEGKLELISA